MKKIDVTLPMVGLTVVSLPLVGLPMVGADFGLIQDEEKGEYIANMLTEDAMCLLMEDEGVMVLE